MVLTFSKSSNMVASSKKYLNSTVAQNKGQMAGKLTKLLPKYETLTILLLDDVEIKC